MSGFLEKYLKRIGFTGRLRPDLVTLEQIVRRQVLAIPFENLDVFQGRRPAHSPAEIATKLLDHRRGGWCYELNGLLGMALAEVGFNVTQSAGEVTKLPLTQQPDGSHLCLVVDLDRSYLVDVGFGGSLTRPLALEDMSAEANPYRISLRRESAQRWCFEERAHGKKSCFVFDAAPADENMIQERMYRLANDADSPFIKNLVAQRRTSSEHLVLRGKILSRISAGGVEAVELGSVRELTQTLKYRFGIDGTISDTDWRKIEWRQDELMRVRNDDLE